MAIRKECRAVFAVFVMFMLVGQVCSEDMKPSGIGLFFHYVHEVVKEKVYDLTGWGSNAKTRIKEMQLKQRRRAAYVYPDSSEGNGSAGQADVPETVVETTTTLSPETTTTTRHKSLRPGNGGVAVTTTLPGEVKPLSSEIEDCYDDHSYIIGLLNDESSASDSLCALNNMTVLVVVTGPDDMLLEKTFWVEDCKVIEAQSFEREPTIWITVNDEDAAFMCTELYDGATKKEAVETALALWENGRIDVYPVGDAKLFKNILDSLIN